MFADMFRSVASTLGDPAEALWYKIFIVVMLLLFAGLAWMLGKRAWHLIRTPLNWWRERQAWKALAAATGWTTPATRKLAGEQGGRAWRLRAHLKGAWISDVDANVEGNPPSQAQWRMRDLPWTGHLILLSRSQDEALLKQAGAQAGAGEVADVALAAAGMAGLLLGQAWAGAALNLSGAFGEGGAPSSSTSPSLTGVPVGSEDFQKQFVVRSDNVALAHQLINDEVESLLAALHDGADPADPFSAQYADGALTLCHLGNFGMALRAERLCRLGLAMTRVDAAKG